MSNQTIIGRSIPGLDWINYRRRRFANWRQQRPFLGGVLLCLAGVIITWVPMQILPDIIFIGGQTAGFLAIGAMFGAFVFLSGVFALYRPDLSTMIGTVGVTLSILSLFGSLGGLLFGLLFGIVGGNLCVAWKPASTGETDEDEGDGTAQPSKTSRTIARARDLVGGLRDTRPTRNDEN